MWFNFHTHSNYCDGKETMDDYISSALDKELVSLGFSSHAPLPFPCTWCMAEEKFLNYILEIEQLRRSFSQLEVYKSLEIDFIPSVISPATFRAKLDYTIGSIHFTDAFPDGRHWEIDGSHQSFLEGLLVIFNNNMKHAVSRYFELTREMITTSAPTIVGHLDKIKIQNAGEKFFSESDPWYVNEVKKTIDVIERHGTIVEVNTRGIYQKKSTTTYPSPWILEIIHEKNIPITLSSDAHHPKDLTNQFTGAAEELMRIGFKKISVLRNNEWKGLDFNENGISA